VECFGHASFVLVAVSYAVDDYFWLRCISMAASSVMLVFTYFHPNGKVLWLPFKWNILFILLNFFRVSNISREHYNANQLLSSNPELLHLRNNHFYLMDLVDYAKLVQCARIETYRAGETVITQGEPNRCIRLVLSGHFVVNRNDKPTYELTEANFMSECGLHVGLTVPGAINSCCTIIATEDMEEEELTDRDASTVATCLCWDRNQLIRLMDKETGLRRSIKAVLSWDIIRKLKAQRFMKVMNENDDEGGLDALTARRMEQNLHRYVAILENVLAHPDQIVLRQKQLERYREIHHITEQYHVDTLEQLGWTTDEFERGYQGQEHQPTALALLWDSLAALGRFLFSSDDHNRGEDSLLQYRRARRFDTEAMVPRGMEEMIKLQLLNDEDVPPVGRPPRAKNRNPSRNDDVLPIDPVGDSIGHRPPPYSSWWKSSKLNEYYLRITGRSPAAQQRPGY
jgi:CRP-like cAMP-binding protein